MTPVEAASDTGLFGTERFTSMFPSYVNKKTQKTKKGIVKKDMKKTKQNFIFLFFFSKLCFFFEMSFEPVSKESKKTVDISTVPIPELEAVTEAEAKEILENPQRLSDFVMTIKPLFSCEESLSSLPPLCEQIEKRAEEAKEAQKRLEAARSRARTAKERYEKAVSVYKESVGGVSKEGVLHDLETRVQDLEFECDGLKQMLSEGQITQEEFLSRYFGPRTQLEKLYLEVEALKGQPRKR